MKIESCGNIQAMILRCFYKFLIVLWIENTSFWGGLQSIMGHFIMIYPPEHLKVYDSVYYDSQTESVMCESKCYTGGLCLLFY